MASENAPAELFFGGFLDAVVKFETEGLALANNEPLTLTGTLIGGIPFTGDQPADDPVNIVP